MRELTIEDKDFYSSEKLVERVNAYLDNGLNNKISSDLLAEFGDS